MKLLMSVAPPLNQIFTELSPCVSVDLINQIFRRFNDTLFNENCFKLQLSIFQLLSQHLIQIISNWMRKVVLASLFPRFLIIKVTLEPKIIFDSLNIFEMILFPITFNHLWFEKFSTYIQKENNFPKTFNLSEICFLKLSSAAQRQHRKFLNQY